MRFQLYCDSCFYSVNSCINFWDEAWWFLSLRVFGILSLSLLLFPQRFGWYVLRPSSGVCQTQEPSWLRVQSWLQASNNTGILNTCTRLTESEQASPVDSIKGVVRSSVKVPEFNKHLKKVGGHIDRNVVEITIKMKTIVRKLLMIKIIQ